MLADNFPEDFRRFLNDNAIPIDIYTHLETIQSNNTTPHRYIILNPLKHSDREAIERDLGVTLDPVPWLPTFYRLPGSISIGSTHSFQSGLIQSLDVSSGIAVHALSLSPTDHVLDICCAPGAKLSYIAALVNPDGNVLEKIKRGDCIGSVTGVDISESRLATCRAVVKKTNVQSVRLFRCDATKFHVPPPCIYEWLSAKMNHEDCVMNEKENEIKLLKPFYACKLLRQDNQQRITLYDKVTVVSWTCNFIMKVIVDAECTHDGSITHLLKYSTTWTWDKFSSQFMDINRLQNLETLQRNLLLNGFRMLKPGGTLVYSTCSFSRRQNEDIVAYLLAKEHGNVVIEPIPDRYLFPTPEPIISSMFQHVYTPRDPSFLDSVLPEDIISDIYKSIREHTIRCYGTYLYDKNSEARWWTSGFFVARFHKCHPC